MLIANGHATLADVCPTPHGRLMVLLTYGPGGELDGFRPDPPPYPTEDEQKAAVLIASLYQLWHQAGRPRLGELRRGDHSPGKLRLIEDMEALAELNAPAAAARLPPKRTAAA